MALVLLAACTSSTSESAPDSTQPEVTAAAQSEVSTTTAAPTTTTTTPRLRVEDVDADFEGVLLGVSTGLSRAERAPRFRQLEADAGRQFAIGHVFHSWDTAIPTADDLMHLDDGRLLMISWNGTDTRQIAAGVHDDWIASQARAVRDLGDTVLLRWLWEMDGARRQAWVHSPEDFVAAWLHVRAVFEAEGADNARFVWCPNEFLFWDGGDPDPWYPGDDHVDWICADGYNWADSTTDPEWVTIDAIFGDFVEWAAPRGKPIMIGEVGSNEGEPGAKAAWLDSVPELLRDRLPEVDAFVYFDKDFTAQGHNDWRVDTTPASYDAWIRMVNDPWLNPD